MMKINFRKIFMAIIIIPAMSVLGYLGYLNYLAPSPPEDTFAISETEETENEPQSISTEGKVFPNQYAQLGFMAPGSVEEVLVEQGDYVESGQAIAKLEGYDKFAASITAAQLELISAEQNLSELYEHANLRRAQAKQAVIEAQDQVDEAERIHRALTTSASQAQIEAAEEAVSQAEILQNKASDSLTRLLDKPEGSPARVAAELAMDAAERNYQTAVNYHNAVQSQPSEEEIAKAEANLDIANAYLEEAEREYEILENGPNPDEVALAEARVRNANAQIAAAEAALEDLSLLAPFSGHIISLKLKRGEVVNPSVPGVVLADLSSWHVETTDLTEVDVGQIAPGMKATITLNAYPDQKFTGVVREIDRLGVEQRGTVTYTVKLDFDPEDVTPHLGMSAFLEILLP